MKRIAEYKKLFNVEGALDLKTLKSGYRNAMKECHPDKFPNGDTAAEEAEIKSKMMIEAYHFLVSIAPETHEAQKEEYLATLTQSNIYDFQYKGQKLEITFLDESVYEYFGVPKTVYQKLINSNTQMRFIKRHISDTYLHRNVKKRNTTEEA